MATFQEAKDEVIDQLNRSDLSDQVEKAFFRAIDYYQCERFWFSEERDQATSEAGEPYYPLPSDFVKRISLSIVISGKTYPLLHRDSIYLQSIADDNNRDIPELYTILDNQFRLHPIPSGAWQMILHYYKEIPAPADNSQETRWTKDIIDQLIMYRVKKDVYLNYLLDVKMYQLMERLEAEIYGKLKERSTLYAASGMLDKDEDHVLRKDSIYYS